MHGCFFFCFVFPPHITDTSIVSCIFSHICAMQFLRHACKMHFCIVHDIIYDSAYTIDQVRHPVVLTVIFVLCMILFMIVHTPLTKLGILLCLLS